MSIMSIMSNTDFESIVQSSYSLREVAEKCGYSNMSGASSKIVKERIIAQGIDISHFKRAESVTREDKDIFITDSPVDQSTLRRHYLKGNYSEYKCAICGQEPLWNGKELVLTLDHINGHNKDDRLENLRWICPNCDRQLPTFAGRNIVTEEHKNYCIDCGAEIRQSSTRCPRCSKKYNGLKKRVGIRPTRQELKELIRTKSFCQIGRDYSVTDNAIRKWCDEYSLPRTKKIINKYKDEQWELV